MARKLERPPPSSAVARLLDTSAISAAIAAAPTHAISEPLPRARTPEGPQASAAATRPVKREIVLTRESDEQFQALIDACRQATGSRVTASHVARALFRVVAEAMPGIRRSLAELGPQRLPSNAPGFDHDRAHFEHRLARALARGLAATPATSTSHAPTAPP